MRNDGSLILRISGQFENNEEYSILLVWDATEKTLNKIKDKQIYYCYDINYLNEGLSNILSDAVFYVLSRHGY